MTMNYHYRAKRFAASLPKSQSACHPEGNDETESVLWTEKTRAPEAGMIIHHSMMEQARVWVWHDKPGEKQPRESFQPPPSTKFHRQSDFTPKAVGAWAAGNKGGRILCRAYQQNQCAGNCCSMRAHVWALVGRDSGHVRGMEHPACKHRWDKKTTKQAGKRDTKEDRR